MSNYGLVFKLHDEVLLSRYIETPDGLSLTDPEAIDDGKGIYADFDSCTFSFVEIKQFQQDVFYLNDLKSIKITHDFNPEKDIESIIEEDKFIDFATQFYHMVLHEEGD